MEFTNLLYLFALLACPIAMGAMMWMMGRNMHGQDKHSVAESQQSVQPTAERLSALRAQRQALEAEIAEVASLAELEARRDKLRQEEKLVVDKFVANNHAN